MTRTIPLNPSILSTFATIQRYAHPMEPVFKMVHVTVVSDGKVLLALVV
jgi:hypothetical protein